MHKTTVISALCKAHLPQEHVEICTGRALLEASSHQTLRRVQTSYSLNRAQAEVAVHHVATYVPSTQPVEI